MHPYRCISNKLQTPSPRKGNATLLASAVVDLDNCRHHLPARGMQPFGDSVVGFTRQKLQTPSPRKGNATFLVLWKSRQIVNCRHHLPARGMQRYPGKSQVVELSLLQTPSPRKGNATFCKGSGVLFGLSLIADTISPQGECNCICICCICCNISIRIYCRHHLPARGMQLFFQTFFQGIRTYAK